MSEYREFGPTIAETMNWDAIASSDVARSMVSRIQRNITLDAIDDPLIAIAEGAASLPFTTLGVKLIQKLDGAKREELGTILEQLNMVGSVPELATHPTLQNEIRIIGVIKGEVERKLNKSGGQIPVFQPEIDVKRSRIAKTTHAGRP